MDFPARCLRGIPNTSQEFLYPDGTVTPAVFQFMDRDEEWMDLSINWEDDNGASETLLNQTKQDGEIQFKAGYAIIPREEIDHYSRQPAILGALSYDRKPLDNNIYHGNILLLRNIPKLKKRTVQAVLASIVSEVVPRE